MEAKRNGATIIHVDPRFTRTSAVADIHVPIRARSGIAFLGALVNYVLQNELDFREYVVAYTNAPTIIDADFQSPEELDGLFSGFDPERGQYNPDTWQYDGARAAASAGQRDPDQAVGVAGGDDSGDGDDAGSDSGGESHKAAHEAARSDSHGSGGPAVG